MRHANLLMAAPGIDALDAFAALFFKLMAVDSFEERESDHYADGHYFTGQKGEWSYKVMLTDDEDHGDVPYWVRVSAVSGATLEPGDVDAVARQLVQAHGFKVARVDNLGQVSEERNDYAG